MRLGIKRRLYIAAGVVSLALGIIGIPLPLLPTTPFLLLAAFCFSQGSERFHDWLVNHRVLGAPIRDWRNNRAIGIESKLLSTGMVAVGYGVLLYSFPGAPFAAKVGYPLLVLPGLVILWTHKGRPRRSRSQRASPGQSQ